MAGDRSGSATRTSTRTSTRTDVRLLVPAVAAWAAVAVLLGSTARMVAAVAAAALLAAAGCALAWRWVVARSRPPNRRGPEGTASAAASAARRQPGRAVLAAPVLGVTTLTALATSLALAALASASSIREAGPVRDLADQRAVVSVIG